MTMNPPSTYAQPLRELGLTALEAEIYAFLASGDPATGYRVAHEIERPTANTYKALESLRSRGAVVVEDGARRLYRAVAPGELLRTLERRFTASKERAAQALAGLGRPTIDDGVYRLRSTDQVVERLADILARARETILGRVPSAIATRVRTALSSAPARGVDVTLSIDAALELDDIEQIMDPAAARGLVVVVDQREMQIAAFEGETLRHAIYTASPEISEAQNRLLAAEHLYLRLGRSLAEGLSIDDLEAFHERCRRQRRPSSAR